MSITTDGEEEPVAPPPDSVGSAEIIDGEVMSVDLDDGAVTTAKLDNGAVTDAKITGPISEAKLDLAGAKDRANHTGTQTLSTISDAGTAAAADSADLLARANHTGTQTLATISDSGTAAALDVPAAGDAAAGEVVKGDDSRLTDARTPTAHSHTLADVTDSGSMAAEDTADYVAAAGDAMTGALTNTNDITARFGSGDPVKIGDVGGDPGIDIDGATITSPSSFNLTTNSDMVVGGSHRVGTGGSNNRTLIQNQNIQQWNGSRTNPDFRSLAGYMQWDFDDDSTADVELRNTASGILRVVTGKLQANADPTVDDDLARKKYVDDEIIARSIGEGYSYAEDRTISDTSLSTYQNKLTLTSGTVSIGTKCLITVHATVGSASSINQVFVEIDVTGAAVASTEKKINTANSNLANNAVYSDMFEVEATSAGTFTIDVNYRSENGGTTVRIKDVVATIMGVPE